MTTPERTAEGKFVVFSASTGERFERWPVDAREMLEGGGYTADTLDTAYRKPAASVTPALVSLPTEHSPGVPLVVQKSTDPMLAPSKPFKGPTRSKGRK